MNEDNGSKKIENSKSTVDLSRRRLAKIGLLSAPVLATLPGKSVFARNDCTVSGNLSGNMSGDPNDDVCIVTYVGLTPANLLLSHAHDPALLDLDFKTTFCSGSCPASISATVSGETLGGVMTLFGNDSDLALEAHFAAAYLNAFGLYSSGDFPYSIDDIIAIFNDYVAGNISKAALLEVFVLLNYM